MDKRGNERLKGGIIKFLTISGDLIVLNLLWLICSIPIITIGPTTNALFGVCLKIVEDEETSVIKSFFAIFKANFKQTLIVGVFSIFVIITLYADINYILSIEGNIQKVFIVVTILVLALLLTMIPYVNCLIVKYNNSLKGHIINALKLAFVSPVQTILMWLILLTPLLMLLFIQPIILLYLGGLILMFVFSLPVYLCAKIVNDVFKKIEAKR